jgi:ATP-dependent Clp protease ATP-binding subunit ClpC
VHEALELLESALHLGIDLDAIRPYAVVEDRAKLERFLRGQRTTGSVLRAIKSSDSDYRMAVEGLDLAEESPAGGSGAVADRDQRFASFGRFLGRAPIADVLHPEAMRQLHVCLHKQTKNNVILCGPAGTGKTTLVDQYAGAMGGRISILALDLPRMIAGTKYRGELEAKLLEVFDRSVRDGITLFMDESHVLGSMGGVEGSIDVLDLMKPFLVRPEFRVIGATTTHEVVDLLRDPAFKRRFTVVEVAEPGSEAVRRMYDREVASRQRLLAYRPLREMVLDQLDRLLPDQCYPDKLNDFFEYAEAVSGAPDLEILGTARPERAGADVVLERYVRLARLPGRLLEREREEVTTWRR